MLVKSVIAHRQAIQWLSKCCCTKARTHYTTLQCHGGITALFIYANVLFIFHSVQNFIMYFSRKCLSRSSIRMEYDKTGIWAQWSLLPLVTDLCLSFQLWALSPKQLPKIFKTQSHSLFWLLRYPFFAFPSLITFPKLHLDLVTALTSLRILFGSVKVPNIHWHWTGNKAMALLESVNLVDLSPVQGKASAAGPCVFRSTAQYPKSPWGLLLTRQWEVPRHSPAKGGEDVQGTKSNSTPVSLQEKDSIGLYRNESKTPTSAASAVAFQPSLGIMEKQVSAFHWLLKHFALRRLSERCSFLKFNIHSHTDEACKCGYPCSTEAISWGAMSHLTSSELAKSSQHLISGSYMCSNCWIHSFRT